MERSNQNRMALLLKFEVLISLIIIIPSYVLGQNAHYNLGNMSLLASGPKRTLASSANIGKFIFHSKVGGISFEEIALPTDELDSATLNIDYLETAQDGQRLVVKVGEKMDSTYILNIPDWQLVPIVKYANSEYHAVVTLLGESRDSTLFDVGNHQAFDDNLLGHRM